MRESFQTQFRFRTFWESSKKVVNCYHLRQQKSFMINSEMSRISLIREKLLLISALICFMWFFDIITFLRQHSTNLYVHILLFASKSILSSIMTSMLFCIIFDSLCIKIAIIDWKSFLTPICFTILKRKIHTSLLWFD